MLLIERFVNQAVPAFVAGDGARVIEMTRTGQTLQPVAYSIALDRLFGLAGLFVLIGLLLPFGALGPEIGKPAALAALDLSLFRWSA